MGAVAELPNDVAALKALIAERDNLIREINAKLLWTEEKLRSLECRYFASTSEKYTAEEDKQNRLFDEAELYAVDRAPPVIETVPVAPHTRKKRGRKPKIDNLPVREGIHELPVADRTCPCCGSERPEIGEERSAEYDLIPAHSVTLLSRWGIPWGDLIELMNRDISRSPVMVMDETTVQVLKQGTSPPGKKSYMGAAVGYWDGKPIQRFAYHPSRSGSFADTLLKGFSGYIQTDGYKGYDHLAGRSDLVHVGCFAHIWRKFVDVWETAGKQGISKEAIDIIAQIYRVES